MAKRQVKFIIILPDVSQEVTLERAELLRRQAQHLNVLFEEQTLRKITLSLGVVIFPNNGNTSAALLKAVDAVLYRAKLEGRNRVVAAIY